MPFVYLPSLKLGDEKDECDKKLVKSWIWWRSNPLVHNITNVVVTNFTANGLLALGASPVMAYAKEEVAEMASIAGALVLNMGTLRPEEVEAMLLAGKSANVNDVPVVFDPDCAGATVLSNRSCEIYSS